MPQAIATQIINSLVLQVFCKAFGVIFIAGLLFYVFFILVENFVFKNYCSFIERTAAAKNSKFGFRYEFYKDNSFDTFRVEREEPESSESEFEFESGKDKISVLKARSFYSNLNNSSQFLRRDSFSG